MSRVGFDFRLAHAEEFGKVNLHRAIAAATLSHALRAFLFIIVQNRSNAHCLSTCDIRHPKVACRNCGIAWATCAHHNASRASRRMKSAGRKAGSEMDDQRWV
jgi:hypothetical protein